MTPDRRTEVEAVLRKHLKNTTNLRAVLNYHLDELVDDLLALFPTPRREVLEQILDRYATKWLEGIYGDRPVISRVAVDELMRWAEGTEEPRWCEHILWQAQIGGGFDWMFRRKPGAQFHLADTFDLCPVTGCHAPRP